MYSICPRANNTRYCFGFTNAARDVTLRHHGAIPNSTGHVASSSSIYIHVKCPCRNSMTGPSPNLTPTPLPPPRECVCATTNNHAIKISTNQNIRYFIEYNILSTKSPASRTANGNAPRLSLHTGQPLPSPLSDTGDQPLARRPYTVRILYTTHPRGCLVTTVFNLHHHPYAT